MVVLSPLGCRYPPGMYCQSKDDKPKLCPLGYYCPSDTRAPFPCPPGTYNPLSGGKGRSDTDDLLQLVDH